MGQPQGARRGLLLFKLTGQTKDGGNIVDGKRGNDTLYGGAGNDTLIGSSKNDTLDGGDGTNTIRDTDTNPVHLHHGLHGFGHGHRWFGWWW